MILGNPPGFNVTCPRVKHHLDIDSEESPILMVLFAFIESLRPLHSVWPHEADTIFFRLSILFLALAISLSLGRSCAAVECLLVVSLYHICSIASAFKVPRDWQLRNIALV